MTTPTNLSTKHLEVGGFVVQTVERRIRGNRLRDFLGCIDLIGLHPNGTVIAVQTTSAANVAARITKVRESEHLDLMLDCGWMIRVHGWAFRSNEWVLVRDEEIRAAGHYLGSDHGVLVDLFGGGPDNAA